MSRGIAAVLAAGAFAALGVLQVGGPPAPAHAATCTAWTSHTRPPPTIRVYRTGTGEVDTVRFRRYTKNVLSREWISSWTGRSLRAGALIVRNYAWYQVLNWRGGRNAEGECYDVRDDVRDQVYDPDRPIYRPVASAVDSTWKRLLLKRGAIFPTYYNAGVPGEDCGANADGRKAYQWGTQTCGLEGVTAERILKTYYYPRVRVTAAPDPSPPPSPAPTPTSTPTSTPASASTPTPGATATLESAAP